MATSLPVCRNRCQWVTRGSMFPQGLKCKCPRRPQVCAAAPCARAKATSREHATTTQQLSCLLMIVASPCSISVSPCAFQNRSRRFSYCQWKCQHLATFGWGDPLRTLGKALRYVELDYLCHTSSGALLCFRQEKSKPNTRVRTQRPAWC